MKPFRFIPLVLASLCCVSSAHAFDNDIEEDDIQVLRDFINTKRQETLNELARRLSITGEVRSEFQATGETRNGVKQRGYGGETSASSRAYDVEVNLMLDYRTENSWASIKVEFDENAGILTGDGGNVQLERGYFGVRYIRADTFTSDVEIGRNSMLRIFESKIEFGSRFDGVLFRFDKAMQDYGDIYLHTGVFLIDEHIDHYGYIAEVGFLNIGNAGPYIKYSIIDWDTKDSANAKYNGSYRFIDSQIVLAYRTVPKKLNKVLILYSAFLINHAAERREISDNQLANLGGYVGFQMGQLRKQGDWAIDANYQVVEAQAIPAFDASGIGLGNAGRQGFYTKKTRGDGGDTPNYSVKNAAGNGNYRGFMIQWDYMLTNGLVCSQSWQQSITLNDSIGPFRRFKQYELEFIYAF